MTHPLVELARRAIVSYVEEGIHIEPPDDTPPLMAQEAGAFVSLHDAEGNLRGCIGTIEPTKANLAEEVIANAISAATRDPRFPALQTSEIEGLDISVDVLSPPEEVGGPEDLDPSRYGLIIQSTRTPWKRGLLLPDLPGITTVEDQIHWTRLHKANIQDPDEPVKMLRFEVTRYH